MSARAGIPYVCLTRAHANSIRLLTRTFPSPPLSRSQCVRPATAQCAARVARVFANLPPIQEIRTPETNGFTKLYAKIKQIFKIQSEFRQFQPMSEQLNISKVSGLGRHQIYRFLVSMCMLPLRSALCALGIQPPPAGRPRARSHGHLLITSCDDSSSPVGYPIPV